MTAAIRLFELQQLDTQLQNLLKMADDINRQLTENESLNKAKNDLDASQKNLNALSKQQKELDQEVSSIAETAKKLKNRLYGGTVKNPKELMDIEQDLNGITTNLTAKEDTLLALMAEIETAGKTADDNARRVSTIESTWATEKTVLSQRKEEIDSKIAVFTRQRQDAVGEIDHQTMGLYTTLMSKRGTAVAHVEMGRCQGCRVNISITELKQARTGIIQCSNCGRILYAG